MNTGNLLGRSRSFRALRAPRAQVALLGCVGLLAGACTAILAPNDEVERCGTSEECPATGDNRYVGACVSGICVADYRTSISCNPTAGMPEDHPFTATFNAYAMSSRYLCTDDLLGQQGCGPMVGGGCVEGLSVNENGVCDDADPSTPPAVAFVAGLAGQDVKDQFCRSFFCEDDFVCDENQVCVRCDPNLPYGEGGCGELYAAGEPSCIYLQGAQLEAQCAGPDADTDEPVFGNCE